jgi:hypothetical protein
MLRITEEVFCGLRVIDSADNVAVQEVGKPVSVRLYVSLTSPVFETCIDAWTKTPGFTIYVVGVVDKDTP